MDPRELITALVGEAEDVRGAEVLAMEDLDTSSDSFERQTEGRALP